MRRHFVEGNQLFYFGDGWTAVTRWDEDDAYREGLEKVDGSKAVDFVGVLRGQLVIMEMKDYRGRTREKDDALRVEFHSKVRDTVAALVGEYRTESHRRCKPFVDALLDRQKKVQICLWLEEDRQSDLLDASGSRRKARRQRRRVAQNTRTQQSKQYVKWLHAGTITTNRDDLSDKPISGLEVKELPTQLRARGERVMEFLRERRLRVPANVKEELDRFVSQGSREKIDDWICRAWEVNEAAELLQRRR